VNPQKEGFKLAKNKQNDSEKKLDNNSSFYQLSEADSKAVKSSG